jgi:hypothetical protein
LQWSLWDRHDAAAISFVMDLGGMIDGPNSHPQKEEYFLLLSLAPARLPGVQLMRILLLKPLVLDKARVKFVA